MENGTDRWRLGRREKVSEGEVAYEIFGEGPPVVLVHGTPSRSYIWRHVAPTLSERFRVYVYDLLGFGDSERGERQEVSIAAQARMLAELVGAWGLEEPAVAGHDIGGAVALRAHLSEGVRFRRIALLDAVMLTPWGTPALRHVKEHLEAYRTMPEYVFEEYVAARLRQAANRPMEEGTLEAYLSQWRGAEGQAAYLRKDAALDERDTAEIEPLLDSIEVPVFILWGEEDAWLDPSQADRLRAAIPSSSLRKMPGAGHFLPEDAPDEVARELLVFFSGENGRP